MMFADLKTGCETILRPHTLGSKDAWIPALMKFMIEDKSKRTSNTPEPEMQEINYA